MFNEKTVTAVQAPLAKPEQRGCIAATAKRRLSAIAKLVVIVPLAMALLGLEIELRFSPRLDVFLTIFGVWGYWTWLSD